MRKKILLSGLLMSLAFAAIGISTASAHGWFGFMDNATPQEVATRQTSMFQEQANLLGISIDAVKQGWAEGKTLPELAAANGISKTDLQTKMKEQAKTRIKERLDTLVSQGVITQAQADQRLKIEQERIDNGFMGKGGKHPKLRGFGGPPGGMF